IVERLKDDPLNMPMEAEVLVEELKEKSINEAEVLAVVEEDGDIWMTPIYNYLTKETLPAEKENARAVRHKSYHWLTMHADARKLTRACQDCQGIVIVGPFPEGPRKLKFLIVAMDYFTKWIEAKPVATITEAVIREEIGMPTMRTAEVDMMQNDEALEINLDLLEERREQAEIREAKSKAKMEKYYNSKVRNTSFKPRDLLVIESSNGEKHDDSWRMCVDFKDLNKACPKDGYPLPEIDWNVESLCGYPFKCFLDAYKGYHKIKMAKEDEEKTTFITSQGVLCYSKMPFSLKNAEATYQRLVDKAFQKQIGRNLEVYVDDLTKNISQGTNLSGLHSGTSKRRPSKHAHGSRGAEFTYALRFRFGATNKEAEYEALIAGLRIAEQMGVKNLQTNVDSRLVANQVNGSYIAKEPSMIQYLEKVKMLSDSFKKFLIKQKIDKGMSRLPEGPRKVKFLIVAMDYFTKWIEAKPVATITEAVIRAEIGMPTMRTAEVDMVQNDEALEINLDLLEERREQVAIREAKSKAKMEKYYYSKVRNTSFKPRDLV
nr:reverse transcriptase domain-containing protein [Tanacetum cinerariifolium]